jgi:hypothetical protein
MAQTPTATTQTAASTRDGRPAGGLDVAARMRSVEPDSEVPHHGQNRESGGVAFRQVGQSSTGASAMGTMDDQIPAPGRR